MQSAQFASLACCSTLSKNKTSYFQPNVISSSVLIAIVLQHSLVWTDLIVIPVQSALGGGGGAGVGGQAVWLVFPASHLFHLMVRLLPVPATCPLIHS